MMRRLLGTSVVVTVALVALSMLAAGAAPNTAMTTAPVKRAGISLQYPSAWVVAATTKNGLAVQAKGYASTNPPLAAFLSRPGLLGADFNAIDPKAHPGFGNSAVAVHFLPGINLGGGLANARKVFTDVGKLYHPTELDAEAVKVNGIAAYRFHMTAPLKALNGTAGTFREGELQIIHGPDETVVLVVAPNDTAGRALVNKMLASVRRT